MGFFILWYREQCSAGRSTNDDKITDYSRRLLDESASLHRGSRNKAFQPHEKKKKKIISLDLISQPPPRTPSKLSHQPLPQTPSRWIHDLPNLLPPTLPSSHRPNSIELGSAYGTFIEYILSQVTRLFCRLKLGGAAEDNGRSPITMQIAGTTRVDLR